MNKSLTALANLSQKSERFIIGLMSGTSLDGLDIAFCNISGSGLSTQVSVLDYETIPYSNDFKNDLRSIFSKRQVDLQKLTLLNASIGLLHADLINIFLQRHAISRNTVDCIASHGQTIYHAPKRLHRLENYPNATLQIGDADHIAVKTGIPVISDFRQKHVAAGAEGAPLALYGDYILFSSAAENRVLVNIGGISNFTYLPKSTLSGEIICTDAGPGNTLIDALCKKHFNLGFDDKGEIARSGKTDVILLAELLSHPFFSEKLPKSTGPELFNIDFFEQAVVRSGSILSREDLINTATVFTAKALSNTLKSAIKENFKLYVAGGGAHNYFLLEKISANLPGVELAAMSDLGISADAKEAVLFAILANETLCGSALKILAGPEITMGKISLPF